LSQTTIAVLELVKLLEVLCPVVALKLTSVVLGWAV
jgi:hypothetical protein